MINKQGSKITHKGISTPGALFTIPNQEDFTLSSTVSVGPDWTPYDLADREIGVNAGDGNVFMRIGSEITQIATYPIYSTQSLPDVDEWESENFSWATGETNLSLTFSSYSDCYNVTTELIGKVADTGGTNSGWGYYASIDGTLTYNTNTDEVSILGQTIVQRGTTEDIIINLTATGSTAQISMTSSVSFDTTWMWRYKTISI